MWPMLYLGPRNTRIREGAALASGRKRVKNVVENVTYAVVIPFRLNLKWIFVQPVSQNGKQPIVVA